MLQRIFIRAIVVTVLAASTLGAQVTVRRPNAPVVNPSVPAGDTADLIIVGPPLVMTGETMGAKLAELGLRPNSIMEGETVRLTVVSPKQKFGAIGLNDVAVLSTNDASGWASVRGSVVARFSAEAGGRYLVDFSVGDFPTASTAGTRHFTARISSGEGPAMQFQEYTVPKGAQHVVMIVEAKGAKPSVSLALTNPGAQQAVGVLQGSISSSQGTISSSPGTIAGPQFVFYSVEISRLK